VSVNSVNIVHSVNKVVNPYKDNYHYVGGGGSPTAEFYRHYLTRLLGLVLITFVSHACQYSGHEVA
jgi:hypothetical protein